jgi:hypothetical protein
MTPDNPDPCQECQSLEIPDSRYFKSLIPDFQRKRDAGCPGCRLVLEVADEFEKSWAEKHVAEGLMSVLFNTSNTLEVHLHTTSSVFYSINHYLRVFLAAGGFVLPDSRTKGFQSAGQELRRADSPRRGR